MLVGIELKAAVESLFQVVKERSTSTNLYFICPEPGCGDTTGNRSVNLKSGLTNCWRCNKGGSFSSWAHFLGYAVDESGFVAPLVPIEEMDLSLPKVHEEPLPIVADVQLPVGFTYCADKPKSVYARLIGEMAEAKHLAIEDFYEANVGFTKVDPKWEKYALFPVHEYGHVVYWQGRTYVDVPGESTKRFPGNDEVRYGAKYWIYNIDELREVQPPIAIAVESVLNVLSLKRYIWENKITGVVPVCVFKHSISKPQARKLLAMPFLKEICLLYDHDATQSAWDKSVMFSNRKVKFTIAAMPPGPGGETNDANDDVVAGWSAFEQRQQADYFTNLGNKVSEEINSKPPKPRKRPLAIIQRLNPLDGLEV